MKRRTVRVDGDQLTADIRNWRDQTREILGPEAPDRPTTGYLHMNNRGWWRYVDHLLTELDAERENARRLAMERGLFVQVPKCGEAHPGIRVRNDVVPLVVTCKMESDHVERGGKHLGDIVREGQVIGHLRWE